MEQEIKPLKLNLPQLRYLVARKTSGTSVWGRGTGKSFKIAYQMDEIVKKMPRSHSSITGRTYQQLLTRTLPSTLAALEMMGYYRGLHYFIGRKAPDTWRWNLPYQTPLKYDHFIHFINGTGFSLVSQDGGGGSARGLNLDASITDETLLLDKEKYDDEVSPTLRANKHRFGHLKIHRGHFHFTSMPYGDQGRWLLDQSKHLQEKYDFLGLTEEMLNLQLQFVDSRDRNHRLRLWQDILKVKQQIRFVPDADGLFYSEANIFDNLENIPLAYLQEQRKVLTHYTFMTEILNKRPGTIEKGFYPTLNLKHHTYDRYNNDYLNGLEYDFSKLANPTSIQDGDCEPHLPLRIAVDWGAKISTLSVAQSHSREYRFLNSMYVKHPKLIADLVELFTNYYAPHRNKTVHFIQDNEWGNRRLPNSDITFNQDFAQRLKKKGWRVRIVETGRVPSYAVRYKLAHTLLSEQEPNLPIITFNRQHCKELLMSMTLAPIKQNRQGEIEKDKSSEQRASTPAQEATHFSDTFDLHCLSIGAVIEGPAPSLSDLIVSM